MLEDHAEQVNALQELLHKTYDAESGYMLVTEKAEIEPLKKWLQQKAKRRNHFATELHGLIKDLNGTPVENGTVTGSMHRGWIDVKAALRSNTDEALLEECIRGEEASMKEYEKQLRAINFNSEIRHVLYGHKESIEHAITTIKSLEDLLL